MREQLFLIVNTDSQDQINDKLKSGWRVTMMSPLGGAGEGFKSYYGMIVLEREVAQ